MYMFCKIPVKIVAILDAQLFVNHLCQSMSVFLYKWKKLNIDDNKNLQIAVRIN